MTSIDFLSPDGTIHSVQAEPGERLMEAAVRGRVPGIEAACGGSMACGTCHAYIDAPWYAAIDQPSSAERDMLEFSVFVEETSRLTCQVEVSDVLEGARVRVPVSQG